MRKVRVALASVAACLLWLSAPGGTGLAAAAAINYQGLWWNAAESGWGINFAHQGDIIFATWFTYDTAGKPWWLIAELHKTGAEVYSGDVSTVAGPAFNSTPWNGAKIAETKVGTMTVTFSYGTTATLNYTVNGVSRTKAITKQLFGPDPICIWGEQPNLALATNFQDLWWNASESGWGVNFTHQGDVIFATWFTYDAAGKPWWLIAELHKNPGGAYAGDVSTVAGPPFNGPFDTAKVKETVVGTATATFADGNHATFAYTVDGTTQAKSITRQVFVAPGTVCSVPAPVDPKRKDAARFLRQATFGAPREAIDALAAQGYESWLADQFAKPTVSHIQTVMADPTMATGDYMTPFQRSAWKQRFEGDDQLRQRVSDALLQIFVISMYSNKLRVSAPCAIPGYLDVLNRDAFGNFRDLLRDVTLSPAMGEYLSMKQSTKFDPVGQTQPDENYAREVMQLFSVGLVMLNDDGTVKPGPDGSPQPTFNEDIVKGYANALSGWTFAMDQSKPWGWIGPFFTDPDPVVALKMNCDVWTKPMEPWLAPYRSWDTLRVIPGPAHDQGAKQLMAYPGAPYSTLPAGQTPQQDLENVIDNLFHHPNVGPFIGRQLIQRMVTSNPSPGYVARVTRAFNDNGSGVRGDMKAVLRAILLDEEARSLAVAAQPTFGKLTEPVIRFVQYYRAFGFTTDNYDLGWTMGDWNGFNQQPLRSPSVFNFYRPDYTPAGPLSQANLVGPEFQITDTSSVSMFGNGSSGWIVAYAWSNPAVPKTLVADHTYYRDLASIPTQMVDELEFVLCGACLDAGIKARIVQAVSNIASGNGYWGRDVGQERVYAAIWLILNSPDYLVQK